MLQQQDVNIIIKNARLSSLVTIFPDIGTHDFSNGSMTIRLAASSN